MFRSHAVTQAFIDAYKMFATSVAHAAEIDQGTVRVLEKLSHLGLSIALDNAVAVTQKQEVRLYVYDPLINSHAIADHGRASVCRICA